MGIVDLLAFDISTWLLYLAPVWFRRQKCSIFGCELRQKKCLDLFRPEFPRKQNLTRKLTCEYVTGEHEPR